MAVRKQSSYRLSTFAGRMLKRIAKREYTAVILWKYEPELGDSFDLMSIDQLKALCASVLSQDETKGQKRAPRKRKAS